MSLQIIPAFPKFVKEKSNSPQLRISEFFCDSIQGEGLYAGYPAAFLRLQGCTLNCMFCDTTEVWRQGNTYTFQEVFNLMQAPQFNLIKKLIMGQHLVITGGSPLIQQKVLLEFLQSFLNRYDFTPFIEIENECILTPNIDLIPFITCWNNSPKLSGSGNDNQTYYPDLIEYMAHLPNSWFKFVISDYHQWNEIQSDYLDKELIEKSQIILMPEGATQQELNDKRLMVINLAIKNNVKYSDRLHIIAWDKKVGV